MIQLVLLVAFVASALAQSISPACTSALATVVADPGASQCLMITGLVPVVTAPAGTSIVQPLNTWLTSMCAAPGCNNATLNAVVTDLASGCSAELTQLGVTADAATITAAVEAVYPTIRNVACLAHGSTLCITETLTSVEATTGPLSLETIFSVFQSPPTQLPATVVCTDCNQETYNLLAKIITSPGFTSFFQTECGDTFVGGSSPSDITETANTAVVSGS